MVHCHLLNTSRTAQFLVFECFTSQSMTVSMLVEFLQEIMKQQTSLSVMDLSSLHSRKWSSLHNTYIKLRTWSRQQLMNNGKWTVRCIPESKHVKSSLPDSFMQHDSYYHAPFVTVDYVSRTRSSKTKLRQRLYTYICSVKSCLDKASFLSILFPSTSNGMPLSDGLLNRSWSSLLETDKLS